MIGSSVSKHNCDAFLVVRNAHGTSQTGSVEENCKGEKKKPRNLII